MMVRRFSRSFSIAFVGLLNELCSFAWSIGSIISRILHKGSSGKRVRGTQKYGRGPSPWPRWFPLGDLVLRPALAPAFMPPSKSGVPFDSGGFGFGRNSRRHR
jgi:hypothetical protein